MTTHTMTITPDAVVSLAEAEDARRFKAVANIVFDALIEFDPHHDAFKPFADAVATSIMERLERT